MSENRIRVARDQADLVKSLIASPENNSPFQISIEIFISRGYDPVMKLIAIAATENINVISPDRSDVEQQRIQIFEEYANGGLDILDRELCGVVDYTERILLMLSVDANRQRSSQSSQSVDRNAPNLTGADPTATNPVEFDLRKFLG
jgi:hypothetical protein